MNYFSFEIDEMSVKFFYFKFNDDLRYRVIFSMFLLNFLIKALNENLFIIQFNDYDNIWINFDRKRVSISFIEFSFDCSSLIKHVIYFIKKSIINRVSFFTKIINENSNLIKF